MDNIVPIAVWAAIIIMGLALIGLVLFGVRSIIHGKINLMTGAIILIPAVLLVILGFITGDWASAGIWTMAIMFVLAALALFLSGLRGLFS